MIIKPVLTPLARRLVPIGLDGANGALAQPLVVKDTVEKIAFVTVKTSQLVSIAMGYPIKKNNVIWAAVIGSIGDRGAPVAPLVVKRLNLEPGVTLVMRLKSKK